MSEADDKRRFPRLRSALHLAIEPVVAGGAAILLAASGIVHGRTTLFGTNPKWSTVLLVVGALLAITEAAIVVNRRRRLRDLERANADLEEKASLGEKTLIDLIRTELQHLARKAGHVTDERISLYREEADGFTLVGRLSARPAFQQELGREVLPFGQGVIGEAWETGKAFEPSLPSAGASSDPPTRQWLNAQENRWRIPADVAGAFTLRGQSYAAFRIATPEGPNGVLVFESTYSLAEAEGAAGRRTRMTESELEPLVKDAGERLAAVLKATHALPRKRIRELLLAKQGRDRDRRSG